MNGLDRNLDDQGPQDDDNQHNTDQAHNGLVVPP
jgi:hypothetical protein